jgi:hypothetical protein
MPMPLPVVLGVEKLSKQALERAGVPDRIRTVQPEGIGLLDLDDALAARQRTRSRWPQ